MKVTMEEQKLYDDFTVSVFQRGYEKGYEEGKGQTWSEETLKTESEMYAKGLNDAWECARKLMFVESKGGLSVGEHVEIFGNVEPAEILKNHTASEVIAKIKEYEEQQKPKFANCSLLNDECAYPYITCDKCEVHCSIERAKQKLKGDKE